MQYSEQLSVVSHRRGQILAELLIAIAVIVIIFGVVAQLVFVSFRASDVSTERGRSLRFAQEVLEAVRAIASGNDSQSQGWNRIYLPPDGTGNASSSKGSNNPYYVVVATTTPAVWKLFTGIESIVLEGKTYNRKIIIDNVSRDPTSGAIEATYNSANDDPATQKATVTVSRSGTSDTTLTEYFTRFVNDSGPQSDWSAAANCGPVSATSSPTAACSTTNITTTAPAGSFKLQ